LEDIYELSPNMLGIDGIAMVSAFDIIPSKMAIFGPAKHFTYLWGWMKSSNLTLNLLWSNYQ
jgi:hypothetical protein